MKERLIKLTDLDGRTYANTQWGPGVTHTAPGGPLCSKGVLHAYRLSPEAVAFVSRIHLSWDDSLAWQAEGIIVVADALKVGCTSLTTLWQIDLPQPTSKQQIRFAFGCAAVVSQDPIWGRWANYIPGPDQSMAAALVRWSQQGGAAAEAALSADRTARTDARWSAGWAARWAVKAAEDAGYTLDIDAIARWAMTDDPLPAMKDESHGCGPNTGANVPS